MKTKHHCILCDEPIPPARARGWSLGKLKWRLLGWAEKHPRQWHLAYPRTFKFVAWVVPPADMGFRCWFRWAFRGSRDA
jgi:hypothetical protein